MAPITIPYTKTVLDFAHEILLESNKPYTDAQLKEIPNIINTKSRYFLATDLNDYEVLKDVFTPEGFQTFWSGGAGANTPDAQIEAAKFTTGQGDMVPMHFAHNQIVRFFDDTHAQIMTRMQDCHTYKDNGEIYAGAGLYVDDVLKCADGVWRIETLRLDYGTIDGQLRAMKNQQ